MKKVFVVLFLFNILLYSKTLDESLFSAVEDNNIKKVKSYLEQGANCNALDSYNRTPLINASVSGYDDIAKLLIEEGSDINIQDKAGATALMYTARNTNYEMVEFLLKNGANVNIIDAAGETALYYSIEHNSLGQENERENAIKILNLLIKYGAYVNTKNDEGAYLLDIYYRSSKSENKEMFKILIENGFDLESKINDDNSNYTPLMIAVYKEDYDMVKYLLDKGVNPNASNNENKTALMIANDDGNFDISKLLIEQGANINAQNEDGCTTLMDAAASGNYEMVKFLLENGADINVTNHDGETPLMYASKLHNIKVIEFLIQKGANINAFNNYGNIALIYGVNNLETVKLLVENGADVNFYKGGSTALISACEYSHERNIDVIKYLVSKNANINAQDNEGDTALNKTLDTLDEGSIDILDFEIANFLIEQGADVNIKNKREYTPLIYLGMGEGNFNNKSFQEYRIKLAEVLLEKGADINAKDYNGYTSLIWACSSYGSRFAEPYVKFLVEKGADINIENKGLAQIT